MARKKSTTTKTAKKRTPAKKKPNPVGAPPKYRTAAAMQKKIDAYFAECDKRTKTITTKAGEVVQIPHPRPLTVEGLCNALGFMSRRSLFDYKGKPEFVNTIKRALHHIQQTKVEGLLSGDYSTAGAIFDLTNNHGYVNQQRIVNENPPSPPVTKEVYLTDDE